MIPKPFNFNKGGLMDTSRQAPQQKSFDHISLPHKLIERVVI
jgi:hypothetical protein